MADMEKTYFQGFYKIFKTYDNNTIAQCQYFLRQLPLELKIVGRRLKFLNGIATSSNQTLLFLGRTDTDFFDLCNKYNINVNFPGNWFAAVWNYFEDKISNF